ncbi:hypothetical protein NQ314_020828 [Rhamnusium bicolor]|uniref:Uncharacterized protein n=1 Tax=Rhamnusium bicolor TaxID=1586634 RepID=A0AAV8WK78_9CUCU|nr:hypothetical protein NQ314_020828 [Rhamnusium bicolor]
MFVYLFSVPFLCAIQGLHSAEVRLLDLEPTDAQQIIEKQDQSLNYAPKIDTNVPAIRYLGREPHHVLEDIYLARQYHGQDGDGQEIKVQYWDDGTGFHQVDNVPQILPKQVDDAPDVKAAKEKFLARWHEEAERNSRPIANPYDNQEPAYQQYLQYQQQPQNQQYNVQGKPQSNNNLIDYTGQYSENQNVYARNAQQEQEEESTGPPKGFFYSFDYPVGIIVQKEGLVQKREGNLQEIYAANKANFESQLVGGPRPPASSQSGYLYVQK